MRRIGNRGKGEKEKEEEGEKKTDREGRGNDEKREGVKMKRNGRIRVRWGGEKRGEKE